MNGLLLLGSREASHRKSLCVSHKSTLVDGLSKYPILPPKNDLLAKG